MDENEFMIFTYHYPFSLAKYYVLERNILTHCNLTLFPLFPLFPVNETHFHPFKPIYTSP